ncbi:MAG: amidohydrolase [Propionibacteriaceae bacterium]|jgi:predicted amidohydrolase YtcJ|nr:amidohydrolase [Propionibacteriaceae bacterium]
MTPDLIFVNGRLYQPGRPTSRAGALAVVAGRIWAVGSDPEIRALAGPATSTVDLAGGLLLPGFQDSHVHALLAGSLDLNLGLEGVDSPEALYEAVAAYANSRPHGWIEGWGWSPELFPEGPRRAPLDQVTGDRPTLLTRSDGHAAWANTAALRIADWLEPGAIDPDGGAIERDGAGWATGVLQETAVDQMREFIPSPGPVELRQGFLGAQEHLLGLGVTAWQDASLRPGAAALYADLADSGDLKATVVGALRWQDNRSHGQWADLLDEHIRFARSRFRPTSVKILYDGVVEGSRTAALLDPYLDESGKPTDNCGTTFFDRDELPVIITTVVRDGLRPHLHVIGDRAVRDALDAIQKAGRELGVAAVRRSRPILAHIQIIHPDDLGRFAELGVIASAQPLWANPEESMTKLTLPFLNPVQAAGQYSFRSLADAGARLAGGSDWPVSTADPIQGIHVAVNRTRFGQSAEPFIPSEAITLAEALTAYTWGSAYANQREHESGRLDPGRLADLVVLDRDPFLAPPAEIGAAQAVRTFVAGQEV